MAKWVRTCNEFKDVREMINNGDSMGVLEALVKICDRYAKQNWDFATEFEDLGIEISIAVDDNDDEDTDYYLSEFYDLCDYARVWLAL